MTHPRFYEGRGHRSPHKTAADLPPVNHEDLRKPDHYLATPALAAAVDVALTLGMPLLLTGEPGSGKSGLADSLAWELYLGEVLRFSVKSDTESRDLFYRFDTVGRFHAAQTPGAAIDPAGFITFEALGRAILEALPPEQRPALGLPDHLLDPAAPARRAVVLIDEIDKAPRDVPNDILVEIERMQFDIPELARAGRPLRVALSGAHNRHRPIVVFTSNSEKALPEPFLRRCVFHHLAFPPFRPKTGADGKVIDDGEVSVARIVEERLGYRYLDPDPDPDPDRGRGDLAARVADARSLVEYLRSDQARLVRRPTLAELLDWLNHLMPEWRPPADWTALAALAGGTDPKARAALEEAMAALLLKDPTDQGRAGTLLDDWREWRRESAGRRA